MPRNPFDFRVITPEGLAFSARAEIAVLPGSEGDFAVLHGHAPMVAALGKGDMTVVADGKSYRFYLDSGFVSAGPEKTLVLTRWVRRLSPPGPLK